MKTTAFAVLCTAWFLSGAASAQTTVVLNKPAPQVTDTTIQSGSKTNTNFDGEVLRTRSSTDPEWVRKTLLKFDTSSTIPEGARIASATLTMTVKSGLGAGTTPVQTYRITQPFQEADATWVVRQASLRWAKGGGDLAETYGAANVPATGDSKVNFDVTTLVQRSVNGEFDSRYTRIALADTGKRAKESYREYYASEDPTVRRRPTLTVVLASSGSTTAPPVTSGGTLKVMQWNIEQGRNIDGAVTWIARIKPDVISFNEMMSGHLKTYADKLKAKTGQNWTYRFEQISGLASGIGVAVFTRLPIEADTSDLMSYSRSSQDIRIMVNGRTVNVTSTHLDHQSSARRLQQVKELKSWLGGIQEQRIVAGDFNWYPGTTEINEMGKAYYDSWVSAKSKGTAVSAASNPDGATRSKRIDYIWYSKGASALSVVSSQVYETGAVSDHRPVVTTFKVQ